MVRSHRREHHEYWEILVGLAATRRIGGSRVSYDNFFEPLALRDFNDNDLFAREAMQNFYEHGDGWNKESCALQRGHITWRKVAARFNRGIQEPPAHGAPHREG